MYLCLMCLCYILNMDIEDSISVGTGCSVQQQQLIDFLPELELENIVSYIATDGRLESHVDKAREILNNRYSYFGWKDYMYCYIHIVDNIDTMVKSICDYVNSANAMSPLELFFYLFLGHSLLSTSGSKSGSYQWKYFCKGIWTNVDNSQICNMMYTRMESSNIGEVLGLRTRDMSKSLASLTRSMSHSNGLLSRLFYPSFRDICDPKGSTFAMPTCTYDMVHANTRVGLPADVSTRRGDVDPDLSVWKDKKKGMMRVFKTWMSEVDVVDSYLNIVAGALSEFKPRYAVINSGTGSDGKSTFFHILEKIFGGYCVISPSGGPSTDTSNTNDATPFANRLVGARLCLTGDSGDVAKLLSSPGFKSMSGGDSIYRRALHNEAAEFTPTLKMLCLVNTNQTSIVVPAVAELTRVKVFLWLHKTITDEDKAVIPSHRLKSFSRGVFSYENQFIKEYGNCLMAELIRRHIAIREGSATIKICNTIKDWTLACVGPKTILSFLKQCTQKEKQSTEENQLILSTVDNVAEPNIEELFVTYMNWRRRGVRLSPSDPNSLVSFRTHLEFYCPISIRVTEDGGEEEYVESLYLKPETQLLSYRSSMGGGSILGSMFSGSTANRIMGSFIPATVQDID